MATKLYGNSTLESTARAKYGDSKVDAALSKAGYSTGISPGISTPGAGSSSGSRSNDAPAAPTYKTANGSASSIQKGLAKYGSYQAMEAELNKKGYTLGTTVLKTNNIYSPGGVNSNTNKGNDILANTLKTNNGVSSVDNAIKSEKIIDIKPTDTKNENAFELVNTKDFSIKARDIGTKAIVDLLANSTDKVAKLKEVNEKLKTRGYTFDGQKMVKLSEADKALEQKEDDYKRVADEAAAARIAERNKDAEESSKLEEEKNSEKESRLENRRSELDAVINKFKESTEEAKADMDESLKNQKAAQARTANIGAAVAGQGAGVSEGEALQVGADLASRAAANINTAEQATIKNKADLDLQLKLAGMDKGTVDDLLNNKLDTFTDSEYKIFLQAITDNGGDKLAAITAVENLKNENNRTFVGDQANKVARDNRLDTNEASYKEANTERKTAYIIEDIYDQAGKGYIKDSEIVQYIKENPGATLKNTANHFMSLAQERLDDVTIKSSTMPIAIQTEYLKNPEVKAWLNSLIKK